MFLGNFQRGVSRSCGCQNRKYYKKFQDERRSLSKLKSRCLCPTNHAYKDYGGRGITVCERWRNSIDAFLEDMGPMPFKGATVERNDVNGNYEPSNCRWATRGEQAENRRNTRYVTVDGEE